MQTRRVKKLEQKIEDLQFKINKFNETNIAKDRTEVDNFKDLNLPPPDAKEDDGSMHVPTICSLN